MENSRLVATRRLIDSVWTLVYELVEPGKIKIIAHDRQNPIGYEKERELKQYVLREDEDRNIIEVGISEYQQLELLTLEKAESIFEVINPQYVFSYS